MRRPIHTTMVAAFSVLLGALALGCGDPNTATTGQGGSGGTGGGGQAGNGGSGGGACMTGATQPCYAGPAGTQGIGVCKAGTSTCTDGQWGACMGEVGPGKEECNGTDDDCNGQVDDGFPSISCGMGACTVMVDGCVGGKVPECTPGTPKDETCDGTDENCNGMIDDGIDCPCMPDGSTRSCYSGGATTKGVGECKDGTQTCTNMAWGPCENEVLPATEACDGKDNDCDTMTDENIPKTTCGQGACLVTVETCVNGMPQPCMPGQPKPETCNGLDDDCNLFIDDGLGMLTCGIGGCMVTVPACSGGQPQTCVPKMPANSETCDGIDNNCNGVTDEGNPGGGVSCQTMMPGVCAAGTLNCTNGGLTCIANTMPTAESCDGKDNNCNGMTDEGNPGGGQACMTGQFGACAQGSTACTNGAITCAATTMPSTETCDGVDNDCDGATDEGTSGMMCMVPGKQGICALSTNVCQNGSLVCPQTNMPTTESCNGVDDNCNGVVDDGNPGGGGMCQVQGKFGPCANGSFACTAGTVQCTQTVFPVNEVCGNGTDDDCNGTVDNGCCPHSVCTTGAAMPQGCGGVACTTQVCTLNGGVYSYCCTNNWDTTCTLLANILCGGTCCAHGECSAGGPLGATCDACTQAICAAKPFCCTTGWNEVCMDRVPLYCGGSTGTYCTSNCAHSVCTTGAGLTTGCNSCATAVCNNRPSCCGAAGMWDQTCVNLVATQCTAQFSCN